MHFTERSHLRKHIELNTSVASVQRNSHATWDLTIECGHESAPASRNEQFDAVILCTGLAAESKRIESGIPTLSVAELNSSVGLDHVRGRRIVVIGGGESAVDYAVRLSLPQLRNRVFLSLRAGIRVSPRYHPIRGVPSDFLRNRLMMSINLGLRNWIGQRFVEARIKYQEWFQRWFPPRTTMMEERKTGGLEANQQEVAKLQKHWAFALTKAAKDDLFNMFHNKSDGFLESVARGQIEIVGLSLDDDYKKCRSFESDAIVEVNADLLVPAIGYRSTLESISAGRLKVQDFYLGCVHVEHPDLFLVGFARPIIGNVPTISEMQARFVCSLISGRVPRSPIIAELHRAEAERSRKQFGKLDLSAIYPVEMFPYCDRLARMMGDYPSLRSFGSLFAWCREQLTPATTLHYYARNAQARKCLSKSQVYMPAVLIGLLLVLKPFDWIYRFAQYLRRRN